uniref:Uncharacterized protein n=1 Tax=Tanacetum cinerariifolium TaxID=118510 RepID=A0A6L2LF91_TANCI|nr:hypothetical protein [Tanacetum cinerariifolium]
MNTLVRHDLVRGLPTKCFENDHTCTACLKGKQHKASCKSKLVNSVSKPLYTLHMDLFGPTSDETSGILRKFITEIENLKDLKVKIIRTLIEAARTMLADAKLPVTFWAEAVNTACYVQNRVLVNKSQNKTPYELFNGRTPSIGFLKPFGCHVMILNTLDNLGKFEGKGDEGYFIRYSMSSKAFRVFNKRTRRVEENLHVEFLENKAIEKGVSPNWLFDIDSLTKSINYVPVDAGTTSTNLLGTKDAARQEVKKDLSSLRYIALPNWVHDALLESSSIYQMDVKSAFLYGTIDEEVGTIDQTLFIRRQRRDFILVQVYVDDIIFESLNSHLCREFEALMHEKFQISAMGELNFFLGLQVLQKEDDIFLSQDKHQVTPKECHLHAVKRIFRYLKGHPKLELWYPKESPFDLVAYSYSDYGGATQDRKSTTRGAICIVKNPIYHSKTKHIELRHHFIKDCFEKKLISMDHIHTDENVANLLIKLFDAWRFQYLVCKLFPLLGKLSTVGVFLDVGLTCAGTSNYWGVLRILMISLRLILLDSVVNMYINFLHGSDSEQRTHEFIHVYLASSSVYVWIGSNIATALVCLATNRTYNFSKMIFDGMVKNVNNKGEGSGTPTEPHHTPSPEAQHTSYTTHSSPTLPPITTASIPTVTPSDTPTLRRYTRRARIAQSSTLPTVADTPASPLRDVIKGEACPTDSSFGADQDRANIAKTFTMAHDSAPRVTSLAADEGSMKLKLDELTGLSTSLQRQHSEMVAKFEAQELEINRLKARVKLLEDREGVAAERSGDDAPIKGRNLDEGEAVAERVSDDTEEMVTVLTSMDATTVFASRVAKVPTGSRSIPTAGPPAAEVPTNSDVVPTAGLIFTTATVVTPYTRRRGKETMVESETPKKKIQEQMDIQMGRQQEKEMERDAQRMNEQIARDTEIVRIHAGEKLRIMIDLILKIYKIASSPRQQEFPLPDEVPTASEESSYCQKKREATVVKIALLLKSRRNC